MTELPTTNLPTEEQLQELPLTALVAYAARCVRRIQPLYQLPEEVLEPEDALYIGKF